VTRQLTDGAITVAPLPCGFAGSPKRRHQGRRRWDLPESESGDTDGAVDQSGHRNFWTARARQLERSSGSAAFSRSIQATALLKEQVGTEVGEIEVTVRRGLLAWQMRKIREFVDDRISCRLLVSDLSSVVQMSEAHFLAPLQARVRGIPARLSFSDAASSWRPA